MYCTEYSMLHLAIVSFPIAFNPISKCETNLANYTQIGLQYILFPTWPQRRKGGHRNTLCLDPLWAAKPWGWPDSQEAAARPFAPHLDFLVTGTPLSFNIKLQGSFFTISIWRYSSILWVLEILRYTYYLLLHLIHYFSLPQYQRSNALI